MLSAIDQSGGGTPSEHPLVDVVRLQQNFGDQSFAGLLYSDRVSAGLQNRAFGGDTHIVFDKIYFAQFQAVESVTQSNGGGRTIRSDVGGGAGRDGPKLGISLQCSGHQPEFRTDNGFVPRTGFVQPSAANRITLYGKPGALIERFNVFITENALWDYNDFFRGKRLLEDHFNPMMSWTLRGGWTSMSRRGCRATRSIRSPYAGLYVPAVVGGAPTPFVPSDRIETLVSGFSVADTAIPYLGGVGRHDARQRRRFSRDVADPPNRRERRARLAAERTAARRR